MIEIAPPPARPLPGATPSQVGFRDIVLGLREIGLNHNSRIIFHASLSAFGRVSGGAETVVGALTSVCSLVMAPTFTYQTLIVPEVGPEMNGIDYGDRGENGQAEFWRPDLPAHDTIGAIANALLRHPEVKRTSHPGLSFAAVGRDADEALAGQTLDDPLAPLSWLADHSGDVLMLGVTHRVNTMIHVGEQRAGRRQFVRWALVPERVVELKWPGDSSGFDAVAESVNHFTIRGQIGTANAQRLPARELVKTVEAMIRKDPNALLCNNPKCERCRDVRGAGARSAS